MLGCAALLAACASVQPAPGAKAPPPAAETLATLTAADAITCLTTTSGAAYCWGDIGAEEGAPVRVLGPDGSPARVRAVAPAVLGICAVTTGDEAWCDPGATGGWTDSAGAAVPVPAECGYGACVLPLPVQGQLPRGLVRSVGRGWSHACALAHHGAAYCWGGNHMGELGNGRWAPDSTGSSGPSIRAPAQVAGGLRFSQLHARGRLTCGVASHNRGVYCWGYGQNGQTGDSAVMQSCGGALPYTTVPCSTAVPNRVLPDSVPGTDDRPSEVEFTQASAGDLLACAVDAGGRVFCWGDNYRCALGRCGRQHSALGQYIPLPGRAVEVHAGHQFACARTADARAFCWGDNTFGQLGSPVTVNAGPDGGPPDYRDTTGAAPRGSEYRDSCFLGGRCSPAAVQVAPERRWFALAVGAQHACALGEDGMVHCWGKAGPALGTDPRIVTCENRSPTWNDEACQPGPAPVPGLPRLAPPRSPLPGSARGAEADSLGIRATRVLASRRELRVVFPRDTARAWGWSELQDPDYQPAYHWGISIEGIDGPRSLWLTIQRGQGQGARRFGSLAELVQAGRVDFCLPGMFADCRPAELRASVEDGSVVLALGDSALVARLVGLRPEWAAVMHTRPEVPPSFRQDSVRIEYVAPEVPPPDSALRAEAAAARRRYEASVNTISRYISAPGRAGDSVWMAVGDSVMMAVEETHCHFDVCSGGYRTPADSGWSVRDSSILRLRPAPRDDQRRRWRAPSLSVVALRTGRTRLRVHGLSGAADTMPSSRPVPRELEVEVVVTAPVARVLLEPRIRRARVAEPLRLRAQAFDARGRVIAHAPVELRVEGAGRIRVTRVPYPIDFYEPGPHTIIASFGGRADTLVVDVEPAPGEEAALRPAAAPRLQAPARAVQRRMAGRPGMSGPNARPARKGWEAVVADPAERHADALERRVRKLRRLASESRG